MSGLLALGLLCPSMPLELFVPLEVLKDLLPSPVGKKGLGSRLGLPLALDRRRKVCSSVLLQMSCHTQAVDTVLGPQQGPSVPTKRILGAVKAGSLYQAWG